MKKKIIFIISLIVILTISAFILLMNKFVQADSLGGQDNLVDLAHLGYDGVIDIPYSREYMHDGKGWKGCQQVMCIHHSKKDGPGTFLVAIVDINPDGDDPSGGVAYTANGETTLSSNDLNKFAAAFAYYCENIAEDKNNDFNTAKHPFQIFWGSDGYKSYLEGQLGISLTQPSSSQLNPGWNPRVKDSYKFANEYMNESDPETTYSARIFVFDAGGDQARLVIFGKEAEPEDKIELDINKYISAAYHPDFGDIPVGDRSGYSETEKYRDPVMVLPGTIVEYTIEILGEDDTGQATFLVEDTYDSPTLSFVSGSLSRNSSIGDSYTVTLKVSESAGSSNTKYENMAYIDEYNISSSDYVRIKFDEEEEEIEHNASGNYKKYIVKHNGKSVSGRDGYDNATALANPITVKKGDTVTYRLEVTNTSNYDMVNIKVEDTMDGGLEYNGSSGTHYITIGDIDAGDTEYKDITVKVTKSDMYLQPLENEFEIYSGKYIDFKEVKHYAWFFGVKVLLYTELVEVKKDIDKSWFDSNANKDYVQLDDVEIAGDVWLDVNQNGSIDSGESKLSGVVVKLYKNGSQYQTKTTDSSGHYTFGNVPKSDHTYSGGTRKYRDGATYNKYYVMFEYNGVKYKATTYTDESGLSDSASSDAWNKKSHAAEQNRTGFNNSLETIAYNKAYAGTTGSESTKVLSYTKSGHVSTLDYTDAIKMYAKSFDLYVDKGNNTQRDTTKVDNVEYLKHMNLGLIEKEQGDLSLKKDVISAEVTINGYKTTYNYGKLGTGGYTGEYKLAKPYVLYIYKGDYDFRSSVYPSGFKSASDDLNITLTYRVTLKNESNKYNSTVREVIDISSNSLTLQSVTTGTASTASAYNSETNYTYAGYQTHYIKMNTSLAPNESKSFDLVYTVNKNSGAIILGEKANIAQIGAYSIYEGTTPAGVVDKDSNPGIVNPTIVPTITDDSKYEDHCFYTSIKITTDSSTGGGSKVKRIIKGNVWEDLDSSTTSVGQNIGDGKKNGSESGAQNVKVVLMEKVVHDGVEYLIDTGLSTKTNANGDYTLQSSGNGTDRIHAGQYVVRFIYGDTASDLVTDTGDTIRYSGQDFKSAKYTAPGNATNDAEMVDETAFEKLKETNGQVSVARDDEIRRLEVIEYSTQMTYGLDKILKANNDANKAVLAENTSMFADTKVFNARIESVSEAGITALDNYVETADGTKVYTYTIGEVNFGLIERPITKLELMDDIKEITAVTASGEEILHIYFDIAYSYNTTTKRAERTIKLNEVLSTGDENVQMLDRTSSTKGFRYVNIDSELLQGMKITIKYQFAIANIGEIDTSNQNLINMVKEYDLEDVVNKLNTTTVSTTYKLGSGSGVGEDLLKNTTFANTKAAVEEMKTSYSQYKTMVNGITNNMDYKLGYFLGDTYYRTYNSTTDKVVETRTDQIISYVDNDLVFRPEENTIENGASKFQTYTGKEIEEYELLKDITASNITEKLVDGNNVSYVTETKNNLAFNIESASINPNLYKYMVPLRTETTLAENKLYIVDLNASRVLASELDVENVVLDNLAEIVKVSNTAGRKVYVEFIDTKTGNVIRPGPSGPTGYLGNTPDIIEDPDENTVGQKEIDTNFTETVTFSPPTGLTMREQRTKAISTTVTVILTAIVVVGAGGGVVYMIGRKKFYK